jgi:hypothetical protein
MNIASRPDRLLRSCVIAASECRSASEVNVRTARTSSPAFTGTATAAR